MTKKNFAMNRAFSLMEMMIVLLIVSIVIAASAPMVSKKLNRGSGSVENPMVFTDMSGSATFNPTGRDEIRALFGTSVAPASMSDGATTPNTLNPLIILKTAATKPGIAFSGDGNQYNGSLNIDNDKNISIGFQTFIDGGAENAIAIGTKAITTKNSDSNCNGIAIGPFTQAEGNGIAIGQGSVSTLFTANNNEIRLGGPEHRLIMSNKDTAGNTHTTTISADGITIALTPPASSTETTRTTTINTDGITFWEGDNGLRVDNHGINFASNSGGTVTWDANYLAEFRTETSATGIYRLLYLSNSLLNELYVPGVSGGFYNVNYDTINSKFVSNKTFTSSTSE